MDNQQDNVQVRASVAVWIPGDQLLPDHPAIRAAESECGRDSIEIVIVESLARRNRLPYHRWKSVLLLSAMRHYADELRRNGYRVEYRQAPSIGSGLSSYISDLGRSKPSKIYTMAASEYAARQFQHEKLPALLGLPVEILPNTQFLSEMFRPDAGGKRVVMENFYREMRRHFTVLLEKDGKPSGGKWNFDQDNRKPIPAGLDLPDAAGWEPDEITRQVIEEIDREGHGFGQAAGFRLAVTRKEAREALELFIERRLPNFGPYEDAMTSRSATLFHSLLSPYINIGLLDPLETIRAAERAWREGRAPLNSVEGFIRQILGWREFVYWQYWQQMPQLRTANHWQSLRPLPSLFWNGATEMNCLRHVIQNVLESGYSHHIERLMIICNFCLLAGIEPRQVADWFNALYIDAFDWVVLPNVIGMGLNADGGKIATKPYLASANYINKMSDYCRGCRYDHKVRTGENACPFNYLYWNFLLGNETALRSNPRLGPAVLGVGRIDGEERERIRQSADLFLNTLDKS